MEAKKQMFMAKEDRDGGIHKMVSNLPHCRVSPRSGAYLLMLLVLCSYSSGPMSASRDLS